MSFLSPSLVDFKEQNVYLSIVTVFHTAISWVRVNLKFEKFFDIDIYIDNKELEIWYNNDG